MKNIFLTCFAFLLFMLNSQATKHTINASGTSFNPNNIPNVFVGDTMRWVRLGGSHTTTSTTIPVGAATWNNALDGGNTSFEYTVTVAGVYNYKCIPHESFGMTGTFIATYDCNTLVCDDLDACTADACTAQDGCTAIPIDCDDNNACTVDNCDVQSGCSNTPVNCDDADACTVDSCINGACQNTAILCDDGDLCTTDVCVNGACAFTPIIGCSNPCDTLTCADSDLCTTDTCANGACVFTTIACDDAVGCTTDSCVNGTCVFTPIVCDDTDACTIDSCSSVDGCFFTPLVCEDNNICTANSCNNTAGCLFIPIIDCVGMGEISAVHLKVYPNPVLDLLTVETMQAALTQIFITDITGKQVYDSEKINVLQHSIQTASFPSGVYLLHVQSDAGQAVRKILVE